MQTTPPLENIKEMEKPLDLGRLRQTGTLIVGTACFLLLLVVVFLGHSQSLEHVHVHYPRLYAFVVSRDTLAVVGFVGLTLVLAVWWELKRAREQEQTPQATNNTTTAKALSAAAANATIGDIHINIPSPAPLPKAATVQAMPKPVLKEKKRSVAFRPTRFEFLALVEKDRIIQGFRTVPEFSMIGGLLLPVYNDPNQSDEDVEYARAHIVLTDLDSGEEIIVPRAWWIDEHLEAVHLPIGAQKFILVIAADKKEGPSALENTVRRDTGTQYEYNEITFRDHPLAGLAYKIDVTLIHGGNSEFKEFYTFEYKMSDLEKRFD